MTSLPARNGERGSMSGFSDGLWALFSLDSPLLYIGELVWAGGVES